MPDEEAVKPMVDIDSSGPGADIEVEDSVQPETEIEETPTEKITEEVTEESPSPSTLDASDEQQGTTEVKKDELEDYSKDVQRRISKLTKKWRDAERQREEALQYAQSVKTEKELLTRKYSSLESSSVKERESRIESGLQAAQAKLAAARQTDDLAAEIDAQKEIARLGYEEARLSEFKHVTEARASQAPRTPSEVIQPKPSEQTFIPDPKAEDWGAKNKWFGTDKAMTYTASDIHETLVNEEGYDPQSNEYYVEIDKRIRLEFPHKFVTTEAKETTQPTQIVASARRSVKPGRKTIRLTPTEVVIAKKLGVPLEEYAKQKKYMKEV